ncbi:MAG TPA: serine hydrolase domain-containing protein [Chryseolinea sp.]|nr:serine hydrolase domain-containing protein [Chryseolinea sp.]
MKNLLFILLLPIALQAQKSKTDFNTYMQGQASQYGFNGNVLVAKAGHVIYERSFGYSDYNTRKRLDDNSVFDCGSIAKEFTAVGILLLKDRGKLSLTDTLRKFFPQLPYHNITVKQLLTHTSGIPDGFELVSKHFDHSKTATNDDLIRLLAEEKPPALFPPGEGLRYSGTGFNLLASIIEKLSGQPYKIYMQERVFTPLAMFHTNVANGPRSPKEFAGYAYGYIYSDSLKKYERADTPNSDWTTYLSGITGEGMIITTTDDLLKWDRALKDHRLLAAATQIDMLAQHAEHPVFKIAFGYGIRAGKNDNGKYIFHNGAFPGYLSMHLRYIEDDITVIVLSNNGSRADFIADALAAIALKKDVAMPYQHKAIASIVPSDAYKGKYAMPLTRPPYMARFPVEFIVKDQKLLIHPGNGSDIELLAESPTKFFFGDGSDQQIEFEVDKSNNHLKVWHTAWGVKNELQPVN